jgi:hypothetical protein
MLRAMDAFFTHGSGTRRLTGLWCCLAELVEDILPSDTVNELLRVLMDTEALLLAANPRMRDHVRHAGNVFWLGYYLLNSVGGLRGLTSLPGFTYAAFEGSDLLPREQVNLAWLLAALLHDIGYLRERLGKIEERIDRGRSVFMPTNTKKRASRNGLSVPEELTALQPYLKKLGAEGSRMYSAIAHTITLWGQPCPNDKDKIVTDHGIGSASAFLAHVARGKGRGNNRPEVLHAASAIALHNLSKWNTEWCEPGGLVKMPVNILPVGWLLAYCDELQGWGREPEADPFNVEMAEKVSEARRRYKEGYVKGSRISAFEVSEIENGDLGSRVEVDIQYMMVHGENAEAAPADVREGIKKWRRDRVKSLRETLGLDGLLETIITHRIPGPVEDDIVIKLNAPPLASRVVQPSVPHVARPPASHTASVPKSSGEFDAFLCHASEDKVAIVEPFAEAMREVGLRPWIDKGQMQWGDNLIEKIQEGLVRSRYVVVFISETFLKKPWAETELNAALSMEIEGRQLVLPVLLGLTHEEFQGRYPVVSAKLYRSIQPYGNNISVEAIKIQALANELLTLIRGD